MRTDEFTVGESDTGVRLDMILHTRHPDRSRSMIQKLIADGCVTVDGRVSKPGCRLRFGQLIRCSFPMLPTAEVRAEPLPLDVVYEDDDIIVINKSPGMVVHPAGPMRSGTLVNAVRHRCGSRSVPGGPDRPGIVHRLDKGTSGLMVVALSEPAYNDLVAQIASRGVSRVYRAIVWGWVVTEQGIIDRAMGRDRRDRRLMAAVAGGKEARTSFAVRGRWALATELELALHTGRTHQIRVHMASTGHPVLGDAAYGGRTAAVNRLAPGQRREARYLLQRITRPALHAWRLAFLHPLARRPLEFEVEPPDDYRALRAALGAE